MKYELTFFGGANCFYFPRYRRKHATYEAAEAEAGRVLQRLDEIGVRAAHPAIIYGPDCGRDGVTIA